MPDYSEASTALYRTFKAWHEAILNKNWEEALRLAADLKLYANQCLASTLEARDNANPPSSPR